MLLCNIVITLIMSVFNQEILKKAFDFAVSLCKKDKNGYKLVSIPNKSY